MSLNQFHVEAAFPLRGRGLVLEGIRFEQRSHFQSGVRLRIQRPDGTAGETTIRALEDLTGRVYLRDQAPPMEQRRWGVLVDMIDVPVDSVATTLPAD